MDDVNRLLDYLEIRSPATRQIYASMAQRREALMQRHDASWLNLLDSAGAYDYALLGETEKIPELFREHRLSTVNFLAPGRPMMEMIENQVYLAQGADAKVIGRAEGLLAMCGGLHYALVALHVRLQTAAAYERLGKRAQALELVTQALECAAPDGIVMPFAENFEYLRPVLESCARQTPSAFMEEILRLGAECAVRLTKRELEVARLAAGRLSNREIAEKLFLSEGSVKQYINQIYAKLYIAGDVRTKRRRLEQLLNS